MNRRTVFLVCILVAMSLAVTAFAKKNYAWVQQNKYAPQISTDLKAYKGMPVFLSNMENKAGNTTLWYYFGGPKGKRKYEGGPTLHSYIWYCFEKALMQAGAKIHRDSAPDNIPELRLVFTSWSETDFKADVTILEDNQMKVQRNFAITFEALDTNEGDAMEQAGYKNMDKIIRTILTDGEIQKAITGK